MWAASRITHSKWATAWAQAGKGIPCFGTTQADYFHGEIPVTRRMTAAEIRGNYEAETGKVIAERFEKLDSAQHPGVLVYSHGPFSWGKDAAEAVYHAKVMEYAAEMAFGVQTIAPEKEPIQQELLDKHFYRKHGEKCVLRAKKVDLTPGGAAGRQVGRKARNKAAKQGEPCDRGFSFCVMMDTLFCCIIRYAFDTPE